MSLSAGADESGTVGRADKPAQAGAQDRPVRAGFFYFKFIFSVQGVTIPSAFAGTADPGNSTVAGACGAGAAGFFLLNRT